MGAQNENGRFWWERLDMVPIHVIMFKRVVEGVKMAPDENG